MTSLRPTSLLLLAMSLAACSRESAQFSPPRQLPRDQRPTVWDAPAKDRLALPDMRGTATAGGVRWTAVTPSGWEELAPNPAKFRDAQWRLRDQADADIYFTASVGGGVRGNLTRWYTQQFGLAEVPAPEALEVVELAGRPGRLADIRGSFQGKSDWAALIAFTSQGDQVTSLKFTGPEAVVRSNREKFLAVAKSLRAATASPMAEAPPIERGQSLPADHPPVPGAGERDTSVPAGPFSAAAPAGWTPAAGSSRLLHHTFGRDGEAYLGQMGGGLKAMLDVWRSEMGLPAMSDAEFQGLPQAAFLGEDALWLDVAGDFQSMSGKQIPGARMLVAARADGGTITFAKLVASAATAEGEADAFRRFCASVRRQR
ncbi:MAG: hypothetical protein KF830_05045 [Planctomycetes bacterium]|nr:hypothetical protein [Planctomycetota bacterium]